MQIDNRIEKLLDVFLNCGYEAYLVGGCVRDSLMGFVPHDYDITTNALPEQIKGLLEKYKTYDIGIKFGTVAVDFDGLLVEITTYRTEKDYDDNRHPKTVEFSKSINEDLSRRDFTINAIAYNNKNGFVDIYNGREDIKNKIIKCVGIPDERFFEDGLRIIRALRFSATLGFEIEENTKKSIKKHKYLLKNLAKERIFTELSKLLMGRNAKNILNEYASVLAEIIPELNETIGFEQKNKWHIFDVLTHTAVAIDSVKEDLTLKLTMLFHDLGKPECFFVDEKGVGHFYGHPEKSEIIAKKRLKELRCSNQMLNDVCTLVKWHDIPVEPTKTSVKKALNKLGVNLFKKLIEVKKADNLAQNLELSKPQLEKLDEVEKIFFEIIKNNECYSLKQLKINGTDLIELGLKDKQISKMLNMCLKAVILEKIDNNKQDLLRYVNACIKSLI